MRRHRTILLTLLVVAALVLAGCSGGKAAAGGTTPAARPSSPAKLTILSPTNGEVVKGSVVHVRLKLENAKIVQATTTHITPTTGHVHLYLDDKVISMNYQLDNTIANVKPGSHVLRVEFVASDHLPFDPRVFEQVAFEVKA
ncbi:MAG: DUF6130 family protein [Actinomycetota bacterium]|nr:DUF6130 family protein [Actinomycetota bacterium]